MITNELRIGLSKHLKPKLNHLFHILRNTDDISGANIIDTQEAMLQTFSNRSQAT